MYTTANKSWDLMHFSGGLIGRRLEMMDYVLDMMTNVLTSQKWCEPTPYRWSTFHESCLNESTHIQDWAPCGRFSLCQLGGLGKSPKISIRVQETFGINVTFLYFEMQLNHNRWGTRSRHFHQRAGVETCHPPYMKIRQGDDIDVEGYHRFSQVIVCGKRDTWSELMYENIMILTFEFDTYLKHSVTVMLIYETLDKRDYLTLRISHRFSNLGRYLKPLNLEGMPFRMWPHNDNSLPYLYRFKLHLPITLIIILKYISGWF